MSPNRLRSLGTNATSSVRPATRPQQLLHLLVPGALQAGQPDDLALADVEVDAVRGATRRQVPAASRTPARR
jgi:hypothetical protein